MTATPPAASGPPGDLDQLRTARDHHQARRLGAAAAAYRDILTRAPECLPALHGLGLVTIDLGAPVDALPVLTRCVALEPENPDYRSALALALMKLGRFEPAAVALLPVLNADPPRADVRLLLARALGKLGRWEDVFRVATESSKLFPEQPGFWLAAGRAARHLGRTSAAEAHFRRAAELTPDDPEALNNWGVALRTAGQMEEAARAYRRALTAAPDHAVVHNNLGNLLDVLGDTTAAEVHLARAVTLRPEWLDARYNLGAHLTRQHRCEEALSHLRSVVESAPDRTDALINLGVALVGLRRYGEAEACYRRALSLAPDNAEAHYDLAWLLLITGRWKEGWEEFEWRWRMPAFSAGAEAVAAPRWDGSRITGTLLLQAEQGFGDTIQFVRFAAIAASRCDRLLLSVPKPLVRLLAQSCRAGLLSAETFAEGTPLPEIAATLPLMSLPRILSITPANVPADVPYLTATPAEPRGTRRRIGLVWAGSPDNRIDAVRSMPARLLAPVVTTIDADFVSLQTGPAAAQMADLPGKIAALGAVRDFADTAAVIAGLDLVIGVDTAVMHLAGALGTQAWLLLPFAPDYRWLAEGATTCWYPTMRLFRQVKPGDWQGCIAAVLAELTKC
jgi:tetratricopeptide (TPR) repeat protein